MQDMIHAHADKVRWLAFGAGCISIIIGILIACSILLPSSMTSSTNEAGPASAYSAKPYDSPNAVTGGLSELSDTVGRTLASSGQSIGNGSRATLAVLSGSGRFITSGMQFVATAIGHGFTYSAIAIGHGLRNCGLFVVNAASNSIAFVAHIPSNIFGSAANTAFVGGIIKPAAAAPAPVIGSRLPAAKTPAAPAPATVAASRVPALQPDSVAAWPIHGQVTTMFGVPHWPYQPTHTGIDISDGQHSGVSVVKPFKPGRVVDTIISNSGLGNHVMVDHGGGLVSVYGHLAAISVTRGQNVDKSTTLGLEGTTGASTGTHLHFEIQVNGQAKDPRLFVAGQP